MNSKDTGKTKRIMKSSQMLHDDYPNPKGCGLMTILVMLALVAVIIII
jgi:hypothetical protein